MAKTKCPACGKQSEGRFCSWCGGSLGDVHCTSCGAEGEPGGRFCNTCGAPLGAVGAPAPGTVGSAGTGRGAGARDGAGGDGSSRAIWWVAGAVMLVVVLAVALPTVWSGAEQDRAPAATAPAQPAAGGGGMPDLSSMSPRQAADQLFDRVMRTASSGDSAGAAFFIPMAVDAYGMARPLDADGLFHLSLLQRMAGDPTSGLATAREALTVHPNHLLNLASAGGAAMELGDTATAREYYGTFLEVYDAEIAKGLQEYDAHDGLLPELVQDAEAAVGGAP